jgi:putative phosphoesterase
MKVAIFSDIHGNLESLNEFIEITNSMNIDINIFLGDLCGYYFNPIEVIEKLQNMKSLFTIRGNHDDIFINLIECDDLNEIQLYVDKYGSSFNEFKSNASNKHIQFLKSMTFKNIIEIDSLIFTLVHGGLNDNLNQKVFPDSDLNFIHDIKSDIFVCGHTHYGFFKEIGNKTIINPGSLGQPRDGKKSSFAVFDTSTMKTDLIYFDYDYKKTVQKVLDRTPQPNYLIDVLERPYKKER